MRNFTESTTSCIAYGRGYQPPCFFSEIVFIGLLYVKYVSITHSFRHHPRAGRFYSFGTVQLRFER